MKISVVAVTSVDNKMTRGEESNIRAWASKEDHEHYYSLMDEYEVLVMGTGTYRVIKDSVKLSPDKLRIVLTYNPEQYADQEVKGQLEFYKATPKELVGMLETRGLKNLLIVGGGQMITDFFQAGLVDNLYLTIEPRIFGQGKPLITNVIPMDVHLDLVEQKRLNPQGTMLLTYKVL